MSTMTPKPYFLKGLHDDKWSVTGALAELIDNSFGEGRGNASAVKITWDTVARKLTILDNGNGMSPDVGGLFQLGQTAGYTAKDIGKFGQGGTRAILYLSDDVEIWTLAGGKVNHDKINWPSVWNGDTYPDISEAWVTSTARCVPSDLLALGHGTKIVLSVSSDRKMRTDKEQAALAETYAPGLRQGKSITWVTRGHGGVTKTLAPAEIVYTGDIVPINLTVSCAGYDLPVSGAIGVTGVPLDKSSVAVEFGYRVIMNVKDFFGAYNASGVSGSIQLGEGWQALLTTTKSDIKDAYVRKALVKAIAAKIAPLLEAKAKEAEKIELKGIAANLFIKLFGGKKSASDVDVAGGENADTTKRKVIPQGTYDPPIVHKPRAPKVCAVDITANDDYTMRGKLYAAEYNHEGGTLGLYVNNEVPMAGYAPVKNEKVYMLGLLGEFANLMAVDNSVAKSCLSVKEVEKVDDALDVYKQPVILRMLVDKAFA